MFQQASREDRNAQRCGLRYKTAIVSIALTLTAGSFITIRAQYIAAAVQNTGLSTSTPDGLVRQFYAWYLGELRDGKQPFQNKEKLKMYATDELIAQVSERAGDLRFDPMLFFPNSDPGWHNMKVTTARPKYYRKNSNYDASVVVTYKGQSRGKGFIDSYIIDLRRTSAGWRISSIVSKD